MKHEYPGSRSLPFARWPKRDQALWHSVVATGDILDEAGPLAHWAEPTKKKCIATFGHWLAHLEDLGVLDNASSGVELMQPGLVADYLTILRQHLAPVTVFMRVVDMLAFAQAVGPANDWEWLRQIRRRLESNLAPSKNKEPRIVSSSALFELGTALMATAPSAPANTRHPAAVQYRDGLLIALLASRPLRMKNMAEIEIGRHLQVRANRYWLIFEACEVKNRQSIEVDVPEALTPLIDSYLERHRLDLLGDRRSQRLWISMRGSDASRHSLACAIHRHTKAHFGHVINPHLFRDCAATSLAIDDPEHVRSAAALLGHKTLATTAKHYDQSRMLVASRNQQANIAELRHRLRRDAASQS